MSVPPYLAPAIGFLVALLSLFFETSVKRDGTGRKSITPAGIAFIFLMVATLGLGCWSAWTSKQAADEAEKRAGESHAELEKLVLSGTAHAPQARLEMKAAMKNVDRYLDSYKGDWTKGSLVALKALFLSEETPFVDATKTWNLWITFGPEWNSILLLGDGLSTGGGSFRSGVAKGSSQIRVESFQSAQNETTFRFYCSNDSPLNAAKWVQYLDQNPEVVRLNIPLTRRPSRAETDEYLDHLAKLVGQPYFEAKLNPDAGIASAGVLKPGGYEVSEDQQFLIVTWVLAAHPQIVTDN